MKCALCDRPLDSGTVCSGCMDRVKAALTAIPLLAEELAVTIARQGRKGSSGGAGGSESTVPVNLEAIQAGEHLHMTLAAWTWQVSRAKGNRPAFGPTTSNRRRYMASYPQRDAVEAMAVFLLHHLEWFRQHDQGRAFVEQVTRDVESVRALVDLPAERWYAGPCVCGRSLYAGSGSGVITCRCGQAWDVAERRSYLLEAVADELATTTQICSALTALVAPVTGAVIRGLVNRGRLQRRGTDAKTGHPLYRVGDVIELIEKRKATV